ncbi:PhnD/SsuA/transferrin family substrate-binding protein [Oculatella sp. LEGE 06141]|uniref:phosphate/phosphite/phosphonate ABC transporter substrate-binding protein n=1 Tax=Oculatella sp. LEGE 06141 TaxID=1828648 RepID=UPI0018802182|nr:PhnD/SsuA/transferrin family substrate-binding protein [Oculatella sp. LEGE 06141]MBE9181340.1 PhnD/SsuA/transferrin family substrate-binding protein [Oculatella sp. LEGE 06141]
MLLSQPLTFVSYLAPNWFWFYEAIAAALGRVLTIEPRITQSPFDPLHDPQLQHDQLDVAFICGLPFVRYHRQFPGQLAVLAAPVMRSPRYQSRPVYFADVVVSAASRFRAFDDLAHTTFCFNDPGSNSGYNLMRQRLMQAKVPPQFLGRAVQSGSHQQSIRWVRDGRADCATIDSTVLEREFQQFPDLLNQVRVIDAIGPCPMPPIVASKRFGSTVIQQMRSALLHPDAELQAAMDQADVQRYAAVDMADYEAIGRAYDEAIAAGYATIGAEAVPSGG